MDFTFDSMSDSLSLLRWSSILNNEQTSSCLPPTPDDIRGANDSSSLTESLIPGGSVSWDAVLDSTSLGAGFNLDCFDGLDEALIYSPTEAFVDVCWADATYSPSYVSSPVRELPSRNERRVSPPPTVTDSSIDSSSDESTSDSDELSTLKDDISPATLPPPYDTGFHLNHQPTTEPISLTKYVMVPHNDHTSFICLEPRHGDYQQNGIGLFPVPTDQPKSRKVDRVAAFCANLPTRLLRST